ncbi:MAG: HlyD family efflux transporter periplasmic adaptor subunit [Acidobacteria bacterium]|nr:HlyD family efflux transporter periplasmic adaptor subunit [Acidobacteriota bacterium]
MNFLRFDWFFALPITKQALWLTIAALLGSCKPPGNGAWQGYVEGDTLYISAPVSGNLIKLEVERGAQVEPQATLFGLDPQPDQSALLAARAEYEAIQNEINDLHKGLRPDEIRVIQAEKDLAASGIQLAQLELQRIHNLTAQNMASQEAEDLARAELTNQESKYEQASARLDSAQIGARPDLIRATEARAQAAEAKIRQLQWAVDQKQQDAPAAGKVEDVYYRPGEFVPAGKPVLALLPPDRIKVRFFVDEPHLQSLHLGETVTISGEGFQPISAKIRFISSEAEYTPPFIYSKENRQKFVYLVEAWPEPQDATRLNLGLPVDVALSTPQP